VFLNNAGRVDGVEDNSEQEQVGASGFDQDAHGQADETAMPFDSSSIADAMQPGDEPAPAERTAEQFASGDALATISATQESLHSQPTDLSLIAVGGAASAGSTASPEPRRRSRPRIRIALPRGRLALLWPLAAALLIAGVILTGLGAQGRNVVDLVSAPFLAARARATPTLAPTSAATATVPTVSSTPTPRTPSPAQRMRQLNAAMGCASGAPPALTKPIYTSKGFVAGTPAPNEVALTFDDGPTPYTTPPILDYLEQNHVPATFFVEGGYARVWPYLVQREWDDGFAIGMHSWDHPVLTILPDSQMPHQFGDSLNAIHAAIGKDACIWFWRPPYGSYDPRILGVAQSYSLTTIMWDDDSVDYSRPGPEHIAATVLSEAHPGAVILMHDGPARREQTLAALPLILAGLTARGLKPVTLPQLLADTLYPGVDMQLNSRHDKPDTTI
jgi:peptidoglycan/xylan/chitin deacetylase (PgdA/CDA1 family)